MNFKNELKEYLDLASDSDVHKANRILKKAEYQLAVSEFDKGYVVIVPSESYSIAYTVSVIEASGFLEVLCECPAYEEYGYCKHAVAAVTYLYKNYILSAKHNLDKVGEVVEFETVSSPVTVSFSALGRQTNGAFVFEMTSIDLWQIVKLAGNPKPNDVSKLSRKVQLIKTEGSTLELQIGGSKSVNYNIVIKFDGKKRFETSCSCALMSSYLCMHVLACFDNLAKAYGPRYFDKFKTFEKEKNELLKPFGLTLADPEAADFEFEVGHWGTPSIKKMPGYYISGNEVNFIKDFKNNFLQLTPSFKGQIRPILPADELVSYEIGLLFNLGSNKHIGLELEALQMVETKGKLKFVKLKLVPSNYALLKPLSDEIYYSLTSFSDEALLGWITQHVNSYLKNYSNPWVQLHQDDLAKIYTYFADLLKTNWQTLAQCPHIYLTTESRFNQASLMEVKLSNQTIEICFKIECSEKFITIYLIKKLNGETVLEQSPLSGLVYLIGSSLYLPSKPTSFKLIKQFSHGKLVFPINQKKNVFIHIIGPLQQSHEVDLPNNIGIEIITTYPQARVMLSELNEQHLLIRPQFLYGDTLLDYSLDIEHIIDDQENLIIIKRAKEEEHKLYQFLRTLHPRFEKQQNYQHYYLPFTDVLKNNWFFNMINQIEATGYPVYGIQELKKFRYNTSPPHLKIEAGSGTDWFDLKMTAHWGDQELSLKDLRKAIINGQDAVLLGDGTLGMIPKEWISQYATLLKMSNEQNGSLQISKLHFGLLDQLDALKNNTILEEIALKKERLMQFTGVKAMAPSKAITATLRPYQKAGFQWMQALDELGWGGCLADDMGLGKTLQTITFLQYLKETKLGCTNLVICPTSLLFNWENELAKFCPSLKFFVYYGAQRAFTQENFAESDLVITSYGVARSDLQELRAFTWHYVILDESQAIKNPEAQVTRAVTHLKATNRFILSGTPVQNNTNDLYAQFNFLNPGLLGTREFFKQQFAQAIDKNQDKQMAQQLRQLIYPFMLRRTKEQVAKDLPDKTEIILWCSMDSTQRKVYDDYKNHYRNLLLKKIDEEGIAKAGIYVLEGLLRLRQICDHPALLKDEEVSKAAKESVKTNELLREIDENVGDHKLLVFSQFTEMLALISSELDTKKIHYCYLDGSTSANNRKNEVKKFQEDSAVKVFLISLKAGGVGLNLTAADYVYLVDPWWNPAAEQQAIDRTHRIGQTRKIFAYKMICKDTVEEKILQLQQKKKTLAQELVSEEEGFTKKLTRDDVAFLFS